MEKEWVRHENSKMLVLASFGHEPGSIMDLDLEIEAQS